MRLFAFSLEGDALNWFNNCLENSFASLQDIVNAFTDRYGYQSSSPCAPKIMQQNEGDLVKDPTVNERFQDNSPYQNGPSTCTVAREIHDSGKAGTSYQISVDNERENDKHLIEELKQLVKDIQFSQKQLVKYMELNQEKIVTNYVKDMRTLYTQLEKHDEEMEIMKSKHSDHVTTVVEKCAQNMEDIRTNMQKEMKTMKANHGKEINSMQSKFLTMDEEMNIMRFDYNNLLATMQANHKIDINYAKLFHGHESKE